MAVLNDLEEIRDKALSFANISSCASFPYATERTVSDFFMELAKDLDTVIAECGVNNSEE